MSSNAPDLNPGSTDEPKPVTVQGMTPVTLKDMLLRHKLHNTGFNQGMSADEKKIKKNKYAENINAAGSRPVDVKVVTLTTPVGDLHLPAGFYLLTAGTGGGKSITAAGIVLTALAQNKQAQYCYCNEARTPKEDNHFYLGNLPTAEQKDAITRWPDYLKSYLEGSGTSDTPNLVVIDSIALPLRSYRAKERSGMATMAQGMQPMDIEFVVVCEEIAVQNNAVVIGIVNDELVPFSTKLEGMSEGIIIVHSAGRFAVRSRFDRKFNDFQLHRDAVSAGAQFLRYTDWTTQDQAIFGLNDR